MTTIRTPPSAALDAPPCPVGPHLAGLRSVGLAGPGPISALPHAPDFLLGMIDVRGSGYPVVDLRLKLGLPRAEQTATTRIIILDVVVSGRRTGVGFVADRVFEVTSLDKRELEPAPEVGGRWQSNYIKGIGRKGTAFVVIFDLDHLMGGTLLDARPATADAA